ncbi:MAG: YihY/virulence factor BrkB family protein [Actinomycetota bacterium]|nr:YihY/virulence factor BrkB family protein [Actinomycetota bacterium]
MNGAKRVLLAVDRWQQRRRLPAIAYAVVRKFGDDDANLFVVALGWYGFTAIYPLLLVVVTIFGYIGVASLGTGIVSTLHQFPVIGAQFNPAGGGSALHGSVLGIIVGAGGLLYGAQGVTQTAQRTMARVWNVPDVKLPGFVPRLLRSLGALAVIGTAFFISAFVDAIATGHGRSYAIRASLLGIMVVANVGFYLAAFRILTPSTALTRQLLPGAIVAGTGFTVLTTFGTGLVQHQLRNTSNTYGAFASVIGVVTYLLLLAKLTVYSAEINPVLSRRLWPRSFGATPPTEADKEVLRDLAHED